MVNSNFDDEYFNKLLDINLENFKTFQKIFAIILGFSLFFLLTAIFPYFTNVYEQKEKQIKIDFYNKTINDYEKKILDLNNSIPLTSSLIEETDNRISNVNSSSNVEKTIKPLLEKVGISLNNSNDKELISMLQSGEEFAINGTKKIAEMALESLNYDRNLLLEQNSSLHKELKNNIENKSNLESNRTNTITALNDDKGNLDKLIKKWNEINSPFGNVPIDFSHLLAIFPISLAGGFSVCKVLLYNSINLRKEFKIINDKQQNNKYENNKVLIDLIMHSWLNPEDSVHNKFIRFSILLLPFVIFIISVSMISYSWENTSEPPFSSTILVKNTYYGIYILCFGIFIYNYLQLFLSIKKIAN